MSEEKRRRYPWNVWDPYTEGGSYLDGIIEGVLGDSERNEELKRQKDMDIFQAMMASRRMAIEDEMNRMQQEATELRLRIQREQYDMKKKEYEEQQRRLEEEIRKRNELLERPRRAIENFWSSMNTGLRLLTHSPPRYAEGIAQFNQGQALMAGEIQFLIPETQEYKTMMNDLRWLAQAYSLICKALLEFSAGGDYRSTFSSALAALENARNTIPSMYTAIRTMCEAFTDEGQTRETDFRIAVQATPERPDAGAVILLLMALVLNHQEKKYDELVEELYRKLHQG